VRAKPVRCSPKDGGEQSGLSLIHAVLVDVSKRWRGIKMAPADLEKLNLIRAEVVPLAAAG